jgi:hypothetical protein
MHSLTNNRRHPLYGTVADDTKLGMALLIAETENGAYEPIWSRDYDGHYAVICQLDATTMTEVE